MTPRHSIAAWAALVAATPAVAQERAVSLDLPAGPAEDAIRTLGRQGRVSVGFRDRSLARIVTRALRGTFTPEQALAKLFADTRARPRRVAAGSFVIERAPTPKRIVATPTARPRPPALSPQPAGADIIVTASKRAVPLSDYAGAAQIIDGRALSLADAKSGTDLIERRAASVSSTHLGPGRNKLFIRGIADSSFVGPTQATVGQYWGNSRITYSAPDPSLRLYDVKSVEVLEGPQGTLYGAGSLGGVVRVLPNAPDLNLVGGHVWGGAQAVQHGDPGVDGGATVNVPLVEGKLGLRVLGYGGIDGGYIDDRLRGLQDVNRVATWGGRAALRWTPDDAWTIDATALLQRIKGDDSQYVDQEGEDSLSRASTIAQPYRNEYTLGEVVAKRTRGTLDWSTSLAYARQRVFEQYEGQALLGGQTLGDPLRTDLPPARDAPATAYTQENRIEMLTAETRLAQRGRDGTGWVAGLSMLHNEAEVKRQMGGRVDRALLTGVRNAVDEVTLYGEYAVSPIRRMTVSLGGRLTRSELSGQSQDVARAVALSMDPGAETSRIETRFLPAGSIAWRTGDATLFARYQEGFRPGGIAVRQQYIQRFEGDRVGTAEAGVRVVTRAFETSLTGSYTRWRNIQADIVDGFGFPTTANIGDGRIWSLGWSGRWRPVPGLELDASLYLNDSRLTQPEFSILPIDFGPVRQDRLPNVADYSGRLGFSYSGRFNDQDRFDLVGHARYIGTSTLGVGSVLGRLQGSYVDTGLELRIGDARRGISLSATNLLDTVGNRFSLGSPFLLREQTTITPLQPRSVRLGFDIRF